MGARRRGRPLQQPETVRLVLGLHAGGTRTVRGISAAAMKQQVRVSRTTVGRILRGTHGLPDDPTLQPGEKRVRRHRCDGCRGMITVEPCRKCALPFERRQARNEIERTQVAAILSLQLSPSQRHQLNKVHARRRLAARDKATRL